MQYTRGPHDAGPPSALDPPEPMRNRYILLADLGAIALCMLGAFVLRLDWFFTRSPDETAAFLYALGTGLLAKPVVFHAFGLYRRYCRRFYPDA